VCFFLFFFFFFFFCFFSLFLFFFCLFFGCVVGFFLFVVCLGFSALAFGTVVPASYEFAERAFLFFSIRTRSLRPVFLSPEGQDFSVHSPLVIGSVLRPGAPQPPHKPPPPPKTPPNPQPTPTLGFSSSGARVSVDFTVFLPTLSVGSARSFFRLKPVFFLFPISFGCAHLSRVRVSRLGRPVVTEKSDYLSSPSPGLPFCMNFFLFVHECLGFLCAHPY